MVYASIRITSIVKQNKDHVRQKWRQSKIDLKDYLFDTTVPHRAVIKNTFNKRQISHVHGMQSPRLSMKYKSVKLVLKYQSGDRKKVTVRLICSLTLVPLNKNIETKIKILLLSYFILVASHIAILLGKLIKDSWQRCRRYLRRR